jgi:hypothetical protein
MEAEGFELNGSFLEFPLDSKPTYESQQKAKNELVFLNKIITVLDVLHIAEDVDFKRLTEADRQEIHNLYKALICKEPISGLRKDLPYSYRLMIEDLRIALVHKKTNNEGEGEISDFFSDKFLYGYTVDGVQHFAPPCATIDKEGWEVISNINFEGVLPSFQRIFLQHSDPEIFVSANNSLLTILLAYDAVNRKALLKTGELLAQWILKECPDETIPPSIRLINYLQVMSRSRDLIKEERIKLLKIAEDTSTEERIKVGAYLLLKNQDAAEIHFAKLDDELQKSFREWPIYHFWQETPIQMIEICV